jgi:hypothetical protein
VNPFYLLPMVLQAAALVHFFRRGGGNWVWFFVIIFLGPLGAIVYFIVEVLPGMRDVDPSQNWRARRQRWKELQIAIHQNPSPGNYEELGDLYRHESDWKQARECYDKAIGARTSHPDPYFGRAVSAIEMGDAKAAIPDLEKVVSMDRKFDFQRALGLLAHCYALTGRSDEADKLFREALETSTLSETQFHYAGFLASQGRNAEARDWLQRIVGKKAVLSGPLLRAQKPWIAKAEKKLADIPA